MSGIENISTSSDDPRWKGPEFLLVVSMLVVLTGLVFIVLVIPIQGISVTESASIDQVLKFRQEILTIIVTAFSAWIGAGAAYFFGRENMRAATEAMLLMRSLPPREKLRQILLKELPPRPITWKVKMSDPLLTVYDKLVKDVAWWFIVVTKEDETLETVIEEEAVWRYIDSLAVAGKNPAEVMKDGNTTVKALLDFLGEAANKKLAGKTKGIYIPVTSDTTLGAVNDQMMGKGVYLAIITDESKRPVSYVSTDDIRKEFLKM
jgi:hypothetical protein